MLYELDQIHQTAAEILACALSEIIPETFLIKGGECISGFYYDCIFPDSFSKEMFPLIEERMWKIISENIEIKIHEMIPTNAAAFLKHHRRIYPSYFVENIKDLFVKILQIGSHVDHVQGSFLEKTGDLGAFKLLKLERRPDLLFKGKLKKVHRILGVADNSKQELKALLKKKDIFQNHLASGEALNYFKMECLRRKDYLEEARLFWLSEGEALLYRMYDMWRTSHLNQRFELVKTEGKDVDAAHKKLYELLDKDRGDQPTYFAEYRFPENEGEMDPIHGFLTLKNCHYDRAHIFCKQKDLIEILQKTLKFLSQIPKMFSLGSSLEVHYPSEHQEIFQKLGIEGNKWEEKEGRIEYMLIDSHGKKWKGPFLTLSRQREIYVIKQSIFPSVEKMLALVLEDKEKDLSQKKELLSRMIVYGE